MIVRKKDWLALCERVRVIEESGKYITSDWLNINLDKRDRKLATLQNDLQNLTTRITGVFSGVKTAFSQGNIYTKKEVDKMSSSEYARNVLAPLGIGNTEIAR